MLSRRKAGSVTEIVAGSISYGQGCIVGLGLKKTRPVFRFFKKTKTSKAQFRFFKFLLCNLINKPHIQIVICEIHQFRRHFSHDVLLLRLLEICLW